jgi:hypothetical protein
MFKIANCRKCGGSGKLITERTNDKQWAYVLCDEDYCPEMTEKFIEWSSALEAWNSGGTIDGKLQEI